MKNPTVAFLHLGQTHDDFPDIAAALLKLGVRSELVALDEADRSDWSRYAAVNLRECRGFHLDDRFVARIAALRQQLGSTRLSNSVNVVRGAFDKRAYLPELESAGVATVPTHWLDADLEHDFTGLFECTGWDDLVIKPTVSSKSWNTFRLVRSAAGVQVHAAGPPTPPVQHGKNQWDALLKAALDRRAVCVQPFMPEVQTLGEASFVFLGGRLSHAVRKMPAPGGWLAHEFYGGHNAVEPLTETHARWSERIFRLLQEQVGTIEYARIDALSDRGSLLLLECELIVPRLFLRESGTVDRYADVLAAGVKP